MTNIFVSPGKYIQGKGALMEAGHHIRSLGARAMIIGGRRGLQAVAPFLADSCRKAGVKIFELLFNGECSDSEINRLTKAGKDHTADVIVGVGGGKALDTAKVTAWRQNLPVVIIPTIAATDAPCSACAIVYTPDGVVEKIESSPRNPELVLVDSKIIAGSPERLLVAGMGDALATWFEAEACSLTRRPNCVGGTCTEAALAIAQTCYENLLEYGLNAIAACRADAVTPALEKIIEANILLSGLGFESGGLAAAHSIHDGLTALEETHSYYHGEKVAFGTITQLILQDTGSDMLDEVIDFCMAVGLPTTLAHLGLADSDRQKLMPVGEKACAKGTFMANMPFPITPDDVVDAMLTADAMGKAAVI